MCGPGTVDVGGVVIDDVAPRAGEATLAGAEACGGEEVGGVAAEAWEGEKVS